jgi:hypothetical protein
MRIGHDRVPQAMSRLHVVTRQDLDQPQARDNFTVWVSNNADPSTGHTVACTQGTAPPLADKATWGCSLPPGPWRYVSVRKTDEKYLFLAEVRVFGH